MSDAQTPCWRARALAPVAAEPLVRLRILFGLLGAIGALRFLAYGWVASAFDAPTMFFHYWLVGPVAVPGLPVLQASFVLLAALGIAVALGWRYRVTAPAFVALFTYIECIDVTNYLNHYYLFSLLGVLLAAMPVHRMASLDVRRQPTLRQTTIPAWMLWLVRFQVGVVYVFAGLAKAHPDWLIHAQPLNIWLQSRTEFPLLGPWFAHWETALAMSWGGFLFDTTIVGFLLWRRSTKLAFVAVIGFHTLTGMLFNIGMFPLIMIAAASVFLPTRTPTPAGSRAYSPPSRWVRGAVAAWVALQLALPLRTSIYPGHLLTSDVLWHEQGMRWSWRVMVREKSGDVMYRVTDGTGRTQLVPPSRYLTSHQEREMSGQPDLILQLAHRIAADAATTRPAPIAVYVDAFASLNGRPPARLIDPTVDLSAVRDTLAPADWILPPPTTAPPRLGSRTP